MKNEKTNCSIYNFMFGNYTACIKIGLAIWGFSTGGSSYVIVSAQIIKELSEE